MLNTDVHEPTDDCMAAGVHCYSHGRDESDGEQVCGECFHSWATDADLLADHNHRCEENEVPLATSLAEVFVCPFCMHDL